MKAKREARSLDDELGRCCRCRMRRQARLDFFGRLRHVMARGIEGHEIFLGEEGRPGGKRERWSPTCHCPRGSREAPVALPVWNGGLVGRATVTFCGHCERISDPGRRGREESPEKRT